MATKYTALQPLTSILSPDSLADAAVSAYSSEVDNATNRWPNAMLKLTLANQAAVRSAGASVAVAILPAVDGTNYVYVTGDCVENYIVDRWSLDGGTNSNRRLEMRVVLPPTKFKIALINNTGAAFGGSGNALEIAEFGYEDV